MTPLVIAQLLAQFGPPAVTLITTLIQKWESNTPVTPAEWAALSTSLLQNAKDRMTAQLTAAGIDPNSAQGQTLLKLAS